MTVHRPIRLLHSSAWATASWACSPHDLPTGKKSSSSFLYNATRSMYEPSRLPESRRRAWSQQQRRERLPFVYLSQQRCATTASTVEKT